MSNFTERSNWADRPNLLRFIQEIRVLGAAETDGLADSATRLYNTHNITEPARVIQMTGPPRKIDEIRCGLYEEEEEIEAVKGLS